MGRLTGVGSPSQGLLGSLRSLGLPGSGAGGNAVARLLATAVLAVVGCEVDAQQLFADLGRQALPPRARNGWDFMQPVACGDLDGDGDLDLVVGSYYAENRVYLNNGSGTFRVTAIQQPSIGFARSVALGDVDGDGDLDLLVGSFEYFGAHQGSQNRLFLNNGNGSFTDVTATRMPAITDETTSIALGDVDGDGDLDIVVGNGTYPFLVGSSQGHQNRLYLNNGSGFFSDVTATRLPAVNDNTTSLAFGDVDGDGDLDLVIGNAQAHYGDQNRLFLNNGRGFFADATITQLPVLRDQTTSLALGDVDGDGDLDLVVGNIGSSKLLLNDGSGTFAYAAPSHWPQPAVVTATSSVVLGDVDGDGDLDIVVGNGAYTHYPLGVQNRLYLNNGSGTFIDATASQMPAIVDTTASVALGDVDGDGDLDLVVGNWGEQNCLYFNLLRQLDYPNTLQAGQPYTLDIYSRNGPPRLFDTAVTWMSLGTASLQLPPIGRLGIDPSTAAQLPPVLIPQPAGMASITLNVPNVPALAGLEVFAQAAILRWPIDIRLTNVTHDVLIR